MKPADEKNDTCPVSGRKLGSIGDPVVLQHKGTAAALGLLLAGLALLAACSVSVDESGTPAGHVASAHSEETHPQPAETTRAPVQEPTRGSDDYPLDTCVVTGAKLGSMGEPVVIQHDGREVRFCCSNCPRTFKSDPAKYLTKLDEATKAKYEHGARP